MPREIFFLRKYIIAVLSGNKMYFINNLILSIFS